MSYRRSNLFLAINSARINRGDPSSRLEFGTFSPAWVMSSWSESQSLKIIQRRSLQTWFNTLFSYLYHNMPSNEQPAAGKTNQYLGWIHRSIIQEVHGGCQHITALMQCVPERLMPSKSTCSHSPYNRPLISAAADHKRRVQSCHSKDATNNHTVS